MPNVHSSSVHQPQLRRSIATRLSVPLLWLTVGTWMPVAAADDARQAFFEKRIRPVLVTHCYECHSGESKAIKGGLRLDSREAIRRGGDSGPAVVPGEVQASLIVGALRHESFEMPPQGKLPDEVIADFEKWIELGAVDPRDEAQSAVAERAIDWNQARAFWAFQPPQRYPLPTAAATGWARQPLDFFVAAGHAAVGLTPSPEADRRELLRRVTFDLTGLPPTAAEAEAFVADTAPRAYERLVDRLLSAPAYGERWARMWLDVARYAEDQAHIVGDNTELCYPNAYLYRNWVIDSLNADLPYDDFVREQLAADLVAPDEPERHVALGFIGLGPKYYRRNAPEVMAEEWEDRVDIVARGLLGLTIACARCHDHKYDPIPTEDYYALAGVFASTEMFNRPLSSDAETGKDGQAKKPEAAVHIVRDQEPADLPVFIRGDVTRKGAVVPRHFPQILCAGEPMPLTEGSGRLGLAEAIAHRDNPLAARVIVNRIWSLHFGRGLVSTPSNFGKLGDPPTHPELLDDLAVRFMDAGWSLKWLQREIVLSATYRQTSNATPQQQSLDPANHWLAHMNRRRLSIEAWRDALLAVAGSLERSLGGPSIEPQELDQRRRTVYSRISRLELDSMLATFDFPDPNAHSERRVETTTPLQKLFVLNSQFMVRQAEAWAEQLLRAADDDPARIELAYRSAFARSPSTAETELGLAFLAGCDEGDLQSRWVQYAQVLLASNELLILD